MVPNLTAKLHKILTHPTDQGSDRSVIVWFILSLIFAFVYATFGLQDAFSSEYIVQDDARQHVFWMQRFLDPKLFPTDWIANYFQSVAPWGYTKIYHLIAGIGINPLLCNKFLPMVLGFITTGYCFGVCFQLLPVPASAFIASLILNQTLWMDDDLVSATPRAFVYPLLLAFLYYLLRRSLLPCLVVITLQGLFYPQTIFISCGLVILRIFRWQNGRIQLSTNRQDYIVMIAGLSVAFFVLLPYALTTSEFKPVINATQAKALPEFLPGGRAGFFYDNPWEFWIERQRSGVFPRSQRMSIMIFVGFLLPILLRYPAWFPLVKGVKPEIGILSQLMLVSLGLFFAAHAVLFKLHLPSRYMKYSWRIVLAISGAIAITLLVDAIFQACKPPARQIFPVILVIILGMTLIFYPSFLEDFPKTNYTLGQAPTLYQFFAQTPKTSLIASLSSEADNVPTFSARSVLVSQEYGIPYHLGYYRIFRQRMMDLIQAQYTIKLVNVKNFIDKYSIDFWLLDQDAFTPEYIANNNWLNQFQPVTKKAKMQLKKGAKPALTKFIKSCAVFKDDHFVVLEAKCINQAAKI